MFLHDVTLLLFIPSSFFAVRYELNLQMSLRVVFVFKMGRPWHGRLVTGLSPWSPGFDPWSVHVAIVVDEVVLAQVSIIPAMFRTHIHPHFAVTRRQTGEV